MFPVRGVSRLTAPASLSAASMFPVRGDEPSSATQSQYVPCVWGVNRGDEPLERYLH